MFYLFILFFILHPRVHPSSTESYEVHENCSIIVGERGIVGWIHSGIIGGGGKLGFASVL